MKIVIYSPSYSESSGGIIVLHKLCDLLIQEGFNAGFFVEENQSFFVNSTYKSNSFKSIELDPQNDIIIYPEIILGNPLNFKKVIRYILNVGHVTLNRKSTWSNTDFWVYYSEKFYDGIKPKNLLTISDSKLEYFKDYKVDRLYKECFSYRKNHDSLDKLDIIHSPNAIEIGFNVTDENLIKIFNSCERFYCYDTESHLSVLASLCGCDSIIVPNKTTTKEQVINTQPPLKYGVAYGVEEIEQARKTRPLLYKFLKNQEENQSKHVKDLFNLLVNTL